MLQLEGPEDLFLDKGIPALSEETLSQIAGQHRTSVAVRELGAGRVDLALSCDEWDDVLDPSCVRSGVGKVLSIDSASVVQEHLDGDQFGGIAIGDPKVREVPLKRRRQLNPAFIDQLHHQGRSQHFGDRANVHYGLGSDVHTGGDICHASGRDLPLAGAEYCGARARHFVHLDRRRKPSGESGRP
jgi:hypothetical protein